MGREIRIGLMLTAAACLMAVLVDWALQELNSETTTVVVVEEQQASGEAAQADTGIAEDVTAEAHD